MHGEIYFHNKGFKTDNTHTITEKTNIFYMKACHLNRKMLKQKWTQKDQAQNLMNSKCVSCSVFHKTTGKQDVKHDLIFISY